MNGNAGQRTRLWPGGPLFQNAGDAPLTTDSVLLADFVRTEGCRKGVDLGCGSGVLMLLLLCREKALFMEGLELSESSAVCAKENLEINGLAERGRVTVGDLRETAKRLPAGGFDFVVMNPPYYAAGSGKLSPEEGRAAARAETEGTLAELCGTAKRLCRSGGRVFLCGKPERTAELLESMHLNRIEPKRLRFVHHRADRDAILLLLEGRRDGAPGLRAESPLILTDADGGESEEYRRIYHRQD